MLGVPRWCGLVFSTFMAAHHPLSHQAAFVCLLTFFWLKSSFGAFQFLFVEDADGVNEGDLKYLALFILLEIK